MILHELREMLASHGVPFTERQHAATRTSEESARARGEQLRMGGKALLLKTDDHFRLFVLPADRKLDSKRLKRSCGVRKVRFATSEELKELTGLVPGAVPPFGTPLLPFELFVDQALIENERIAFNAGSLTDSMTLSMQDYLAVAQPQIRSFSEAPDEPDRAENGRA